MKITIFFRSTKTCTKIISPTKNELDIRHMRNELLCLKEEFVNLDKRNYKKYFEKEKEKNSLPEVVFLWSNEKEIKDYMAEFFPDIKIVQYDHMFSRYNKRPRYDYDNHMYYHYLAEKIIETFRKESKVKNIIAIHILDDKLEFFHTRESDLDDFITQRYAKIRIAYSIDEAMSILETNKLGRIAQEEKAIRDCEKEIESAKNRIAFLKGKIEDFPKMKEVKEQEFREFCAIKRLI